ncbi:MAG TPA: dihydropteroate synthase [Patescibacteria group bacterium]|nr:dihydropteroate synthase [Patescibacteria group bacterium]
MSLRPKFRLRLPARTLVLGEKTLVMGVVNVTPDSFSDGGLYLATDAAVRHAIEMERAGADIIDIGGESTRPGSLPTPIEVELERVLPVASELRRRLRIPISIDTRRAAVAEAAARAGAEILNDTSCLRDDPGLAEAARRCRLAVILMHMRGRPETMQRSPFARDVWKDVRSGLAAAARGALDAGIIRSRILLDPGLGFGKSFPQNFELLARLGELGRLGYPIVVGPSRKSFIGKALGGAPLLERTWGTAAAVTAAILGGAHIIRVHDVAEMAQVARVADELLANSRQPAAARRPRGGRGKG